MSESVSVICRHLMGAKNTQIHKLEELCVEQGVFVCKVNPAYRSQRCSRCGWTRKSNRSDKKFACGKCGFTTDADVNGAMNAALDLSLISEKERLKKNNLKGFYWDPLVASSQARIVPDVQKSGCVDRIP